MKPRFIISKSKAVEQYNKIREISDEVSYSVKTNPEITEFIESGTDATFSIAHINLLDYVKDKGRVWFLAQSWNTDEIEKLLESGVISFIVDNENDLKLLIGCIENTERKINLLLRMRLKERTIHTERHYVFGLYLEQVNRLVNELRNHKNIEILGAHFHRKTQNLSEWSLREDIENILTEETMNKIDVINIGGGLPIKYKNHQDDVLPHILKKIKETRAWLNGKNICLALEPGRFIIGPSTKLETEIINIYGNTIVVNCSVYNSAMDTFVVPIRLLVEGEKEQSNGEKIYTIKGCTPCSMDIFRYRICLDNPKIGDKLTFLNAGAYTYTTDFCGLEKPEVVIVE